MRPATTASSPRWHPSCFSPPHGKNYRSSMKSFIYRCSRRPRAALCDVPPAPANNTRRKPMRDESKLNDDPNERPCLILELPVLSDEAALQLSELLQRLIEHFDAGYDA